MARGKYDRAKPETQAAKAMQLVTQKKIVESCGTYRDYKTCLTAFTAYIKEHKLDSVDLRHAGLEEARIFLQAKAPEVQQKTLDQYRQAIQAYFHAKGTLKPGETIERFKAGVETRLEHRAYRSSQVALVIEGMKTEGLKLSTELAYRCGLRAHELLTIRPLAEQPATVRRYGDGTLRALGTKFSGREGLPYSVVGKGGLCREIRIPSDLAARLEATRLSEPVRVVDRGIRYEKLYDIPGGRSWSDRFSETAKEVLGRSTGAHGLRHSYAQERMRELSEYCTYSTALETVSQEMGHFRPEITETYLR